MDLWFIPMFVGSLGFSNLPIFAQSTSERPPELEVRRTSLDPMGLSPYSSRPSPPSIQVALSQAPAGLPKRYWGDFSTDWDLVN